MKAGSLTVIYGTILGGQLARATHRIEEPRKKRVFFEIFDIGESMDFTLYVQEEGPSPLVSAFEQIRSLVIASPLS